MFDISFFNNNNPLDELIIDDDKDRTLKNNSSKSSRELIVFVKSRRVSSSRNLAFKSLFFLRSCFSKSSTDFFEDILAIKIMINYRLRNQLSHILHSI